MKIFSRIAAILLFLLFFGFALKNTHEAELHFFLNYELRAPLVLLLLGFFVGGAALGVLAMSQTVFRQRRDLARMSKEARKARAAVGAVPAGDNLAAQ